MKVCVKMLEIKSLDAFVRHLSNMFAHKLDCKFRLLSYKEHHGERQILQNIDRYYDVHKYKYTIELIVETRA